MLEAGSKATWRRTMPCWTSRALLTIDLLLRFACCHPTNGRCRNAPAVPHQQRVGVRDYVWNDAQTEATCIHGRPNVPGELAGRPGHVHDRSPHIPAQAECWTCHKNQNIATPIGPKPRNMALDIGGQVVDQLPHMEQVGYLDPPTRRQPGWPAGTHPAEPLEDRVGPTGHQLRAIAIPGGYRDYRPHAFRPCESEDPMQLGLCVPEDPFNRT